jgi:hypothetical protein
MRRLLTFMFVLATLVAWPAAARADGFLSPYAGINFGGNTTTNSTVLGGAIGFMGQKAGFEVDFGYTPEFFGDDEFDVDGKNVTMMANFLIGGRRGGFSPYFAVGGGLIRTSLEVLDDAVELDAARNSFGGNVGGGFFAGGGGVTLRADVRYFKAFDFDEGFDLGLDIIEGTLGYWRATAGIGFMW